VDNSPPASPVVLYGTATKGDESLEFKQSYKAHVSIVNVSRKSILLMVTEINARGIGINGNFRDIDDYFFKPDAFQPDATKKLETTIGPFKEPKETTAASNITLAIHAAFVQFVDGSTWGDPHVGKEVVDLTERMAVWKKLQVLEKKYQTKGEDEFLNELMKPSQPVDIRLLQSVYTQKNDSKAVLEKIKIMIRAAETHQRTIEENDSELLRR
jgi:hypothetical protein